MINTLINILPNIIIFIILILIAGYFAIKMSIADLRRRIIPDVYLFPFFLIGLIVVVFYPWVSSPTESVIAATSIYIIATITGFLFEKYQTYKTKKKTMYPPIGLGDIKLLTAGAIWLGITGLSIAIVIACLFGLVWGILKKEKHVPFAPFFMLGTFIALISLWFLI